MMDRGKIWRMKTVTQQMARPFSRSLKMTNSERSSQDPDTVSHRSPGKIGNIIFVLLSIRQVGGAGR